MRKIEVEVLVDSFVKSWFHRHRSARTSVCAFLFLLTVVSIGIVASSPLLAQESSSQPVASSSQPAALSGPSAALRDALSAACAQNAADFVRFLTARNAESFNRLAPSARVALLKRFVLLSEPGTPSSGANAAGRPVLRCSTPSFTTEMQIGGADVRENLAFLPLEIRDATDAAGSEAKQITIGLVRENGQWKLLSLGVLLLDLPSLEVEWDSAEMSTNERQAVDSLRKIADAVETYRRTYTHLPDTLGNLGASEKGTASADGAALLDPELAKGSKEGYSFRYVIVGANASGAPAKFELAATPKIYGRTGRRSFFRDAGGVFHVADRQGALSNESDPKLQLP